MTNTPRVGRAPPAKRAGRHRCDRGRHQWHCRRTAREKVEGAPWRACLNARGLVGGTDRPAAGALSLRDAPPGATLPACDHGKGPVAGPKVRSKRA